MYVFMYVRTPSVTLCIVRMFGLEIHPSPNILHSSLFLNTLNICSSLECGAVFGTHVNRQRVERLINFNN
jgi:hypothetical protein